MENRIFIVHGWGSSPYECWYPWLKEELGKKGFRASALTMPNPATPTIAVWVSFLRDVVGTPNESTYFVGHSIGCQTILHYLESLDLGQRVGGAVLVGGWLLLESKRPLLSSKDQIFNEWRITPNIPAKIRAASRNIVAILSDDDRQVVFSRNKKLFEDELGARVVVERGKGHFSEEDGVRSLPLAVDAILKMSRACL